MDFRFEPDEFVVEEIAQDGTVFEIDKKIESLSCTPLEGEHKFCWFVLQKFNWNTQQALEEIARKAGVSRKRFNFAGTKDRKAITTQLCSAFGVAPQRLESVHVKDVQINGAWGASEKIRLGQLKGNRFRIRLNERNCGIAGTDLSDFGKEIQKSSGIVENYFGKQRFGSMRSNTHKVGYAMLRGDYHAAVDNYLCYSDEASGEISENRKAELEARNRLEREKNFAEALEYFPAWLKYERTLLAFLSQYPTDYIGALRKLPRSLQLMFIHASQADLFNTALRLRKESGKLFEPEPVSGGQYFWPFDDSGFPDSEHAELVEKENAVEIRKSVDGGAGVLSGTIVGCDTRHIDEFTKKALRDKAISPEMFALREMPELSSRGVYRPLWVRCVNLSSTAENEGLSVEFSLPSGSYATVALGQLLSAYSKPG